MGNQCSSKVTEGIEKQKKFNRSLRVEMIKCVDCLSKQPDLSKFTYKPNDTQDNNENVKRLLQSKVFGGSVLVKRINGVRNPLKDQIEGDATNFIPRIRKAIVMDTEKFFELKNVQLKKGFPDFVDIQIFIRVVHDQKIKRILENLHYISSLNISNWQG